MLRMVLVSLVTVGCVTEPTTSYICSSRIFCERAGALGASPGPAEAYCAWSREEAVRAYEEEVSLWAADTRCGDTFTDGNYWVETDCIDNGSCFLLPD